MILTAIFYAIGIIINGLNLILPSWTVWPASVERAFVLIGEYSRWVDPWLPMDTFWQIVLFDFGFLIILLPFVIFSRSFRLKIFNKN
jgi:hypothetical protein